MFDRTVTLFKKSSASKHVIQGTFFDDVRGLSLETKGQEEANSLKVVIPLSNIPDGLVIAEGDFICKGEVTTDYPDITSLKMSDTPCWLIVACDRKDYGTTPHYLLVGK